MVYPHLPQTFFIVIYVLLKLKHSVSNLDKSGQEARQLTQVIPLTERMQCVA